MTDKKTLSGKVALVTGGSRGIGAAVALALAGNGADIAISYTANPDRAHAAVAELEALEVRAHAFPADQADPTAVQKMVADVAAHFGRLDIVVANAGIFEMGAVNAEYDEVALDRMLRVNIDGVIQTIRAGAKFIEDDGRIIAMSSALARRAAAPGLADYAASKAAVEGYIKGVARDLGARGITANALSMGAIATEMNPDAGAFADWLKAGTALGRYGRPEEIGAVVAFLASPGAAYVTGGVIAIDGGANA
ncbi:SDR family NAD(P)-dependent oxidoreductase [Kaistia terrae]|uniref:SDR family NAD(P)-dependent oxidoreductase n=1 Tax=Kaistia terrae TaxID=537017 RepID=A0ABW0Q080_9HYPH|nr:SDR family oxidoreductase [Kaistia terrae]MCX5578913.1 SDR family oxidoreductase [Kaistia terrae]